MVLTVGLSLILTNPAEVTVEVKVAGFQVKEAKAPEVKTAEVEEVAWVVPVVNPLVTKD